VSEAFSEDVECRS